MAEARAKRLDVLAAVPRAAAEEDREVARAEGQVVARAGGDRREVPRVRQGADEAMGPQRAVHRLPGLSGVQVHAQRRARAPTGRRPRTRPR